jgi:hypothetical protein
MQAHGKKLFIGFIRIKWYTPPLLVTENTEIEHPFRRAWPCLVVRFWWNMAAVIGWWKYSSLTEEDQLIRALRGRKIEEASIADFTRPEAHDHTASGESEELSG